MESVLLIVCLIALAGTIVALVAAMRALAALRRELSTLEARLGSVSRELEAQKTKLGELNAVLARSGNQNGHALVPFVQSLSDFKKRGTFPTLFLLSWRLIAAYLKNQGANRASTRN